MKLLNWENREGYLLTQDAFYKGYQFTVFYGISDNAYNVEIKKYGKTIDQFHGGLDKNYSKDKCVKYCEAFVKKNLSFWEKFKWLLKGKHD